MAWECKIRKVDNGYIVTTKEEDLSEGGDVVTSDVETVFEEKQDSEIEDEEIQDMLAFVREYFGVNFSKHNKHNLHITWVENKKDE